jgi:hypothetical protein
LSAFNAGQVKYLIVGGYAVSFHAQPRFDEAWSRRIDVQIDDDLSVPFISRQDLLIAKLATGRAQDLIDVDALRESSQSQDIDHQQSASIAAKRSQNELEQVGREGREGREDWLKQRQRKGSAESLED